MTYKKSLGNKHHRPSPPTFLMEITLMREKTIERKLTKAVKAYGGIALKLVSPGFAGMPDRLVLIPGGKIGFVEVKAPGQKPRKLQLLRHKVLRGLGFTVCVLDDPEQIPGILDEIGGSDGGRDHNEGRKD